MEQCFLPSEPSNWIKTRFCYGINTFPSYYETGGKKTPSYSKLHAIVQETRHQYYITEHCSGKKGLNPLPNDKLLDWSKLKALADDQINVTEELKFDFERVENIVGKGENAGYQHLLLFP